MSEPGAVALAAPLVLEFAYQQREIGRWVDVEALLRWGADPECMGVLLRSGDRSIGFLICTIETNGEPEPTLWIQAAYGRGQGPGAGGQERPLRRVFLELLEEELRRRGLRRMGGETADRRLWWLARRLGFRISAVSWVREA